MPTQRAIDALLEHRKKRDQDSQQPFQLANAYNLNESDSLVDSLSKGIQVQSEKPEQEQKDSNINLLQSVGAGLYEFGETASFGLLGLAEIGAEKALGEEINFQEYFRDAQEGSSVARILGQVGTGAGYLLGAPMKLTARVLQKPATAVVSKLVGKQTIGKASKELSEEALKSGIDKGVVNKFSNVLKGKTAWASTKGKQANELFAKQFNNEINKRIIRAERTGQLTSSQITVIQNMKNKIINEGIPLQNLSQYARITYGNSKMGRFATEALHDAFVFSVADAIMDVSFQGQQLLKNPDAKYDLGQTGYSIATGFLAGTAINVATSPFGPLGKMFKSRTDFRKGIKSYLGTNTYKKLSLDELSGEMANIANLNKANRLSTHYDFKIDGESKTIDLLENFKTNQLRNAQKISSKLKDSFGDNAEEKAQQWLMSQKRYYGKQIIAEATKEGLQNYRLLFPRMMVAGAAMSGVQGIQTYLSGQELRAEDYISSMLIGAWTQRRGNFAKSMDLGENINDLRLTLEHLGVDNSQTFFASTFSKPNNIHGVGLSRDNEELKNYLIEQRIVSDEDDTVTSEKVPKGEKTFLDLESGEPFDPHDGKINKLYQIMDEDFDYTRPIHQISEIQANKINEILQRQGFETSEDLDKAFTERVEKATASMEDTIVNVLNTIKSSDLEGITMSTNDGKIVVPNTLDISPELLKKAKNGDFESWLGLTGAEASEAILDINRSYHALRDVSIGVSRAETDTSIGSQIKTEESLKDFYNIINDAEKSVNESANVKDNRKQFSFQDRESYLIPLIQNKGKLFTEKLSNILSRKTMPANLESYFKNAGLLIDTENGLRLIDDISNVDTDYKDKAKDLGRLHGVLMALGDYKITDNTPTRKITQTDVENLKFVLKDNNVDIDLFNQPSMKFLYQMTLSDINRRRMENKVTNQEDIQFLISQSRSAMFSDSKLLSDEGAIGFRLYELNIPSDPSLENEYNKIILERLQEETNGFVKISDKVKTLDENQASQLKMRMLDIYHSGTGEKNVVLSELFEVLSNSRLESVKSRMLEYMQTIGDNARNDLMSMLKRQGVIKRNIDNQLEINKKFTLEKILDETDGRKNIASLNDALDPINNKLMKTGYTNEFIQREIENRQKIERRYVKEGIDEVKNPSIGIDEFYRKYNFKLQEKDGTVKYVDYSGDTNQLKIDRFTSEKYMLDDFGNLNQKSINRLQKDIILDGVEFKNLDNIKKSGVIEDVTQIVFGLKDRINIPTMSIRNGTIKYDPLTEREFFQKNPVFDKLENLKINYAIFDNNVIYTDFKDYIQERTYNILSTESLSELEIKRINEIRNRVATQLQNVDISINDVDTKLNNQGLSGAETGIIKLDIYDGMDSIVINRSDMQNIVNDFTRFYDDYKDKLADKKPIQLLKDKFDNTKNKHSYDESSIESATRYLILETALKSENDTELLKVLNSKDPIEVDTYIKRIKLVTTKNFIRPNKTYIKSIIESRNVLKEDFVSKLLKERLESEKYKVVIWDDSTENMAKIVDDVVREFKDTIPELENYDRKNIVGRAHEKVSGFDSIAFLSKGAMMEYHTMMGHNPNSKNPIKPIISSQGEGKTLLYGKTLFVYSPSLDGFFDKNPVDILLSDSGAKIYDPKIVNGEEQDSILKGLEWNDLKDYRITDRDTFIREIDLDGIGFKPEKDADLLSASESDADYNYMNRQEHSDAFKGLVEELTANLNEMEKIMADPYKMNFFMREQLNNNNIPDSREQGALSNLSNMMYYLSLNDAANPYDYSSNQVQKYLAQQYIDTLFSTRRSITNRVYSQKDKELALDSNRYGGQAPLIQSAKSFLGEGLKTRLFPTLFDSLNKMILRGQIALPFREKNTSLSELTSDKNIRIVQNERVLSLEEFKSEIKETTKNIEDIPKLTSLKDGDNKTIENIDDILNNATIGSVHDFLESYSNLVNRRYELGIVSRRNPRTRPNDITLLGLKGFLDKEQGLGVEINSYDIANVYEGDYDADKVDYFFAHSDYMFDYIKRNQAYYVQGIDPADLQQSPSFTFQMNADDSRKSTLASMGHSIAFKKAIGLAQKTPRKLNYLQNIANKNHLTEKSLEWESETRENEMGELIGPSILYNSQVNKDGKTTEVVTIDTESLAYYQRAALEVQYIIDGKNALNKNIAGNIYEWTDGFLFPKQIDSMSAKNARSEDLKAILKNGRNANGQRVRIFSKYELIDGKYKESTKDLNDADKLIIREFLNQQNKLLNVFGDSKYVAGEKRKTSFYDMNMGSRAFRDFHKDIYKGLNRYLFYKKKDIQSKDKDYLETLLDLKNNRFEPIAQSVRDVYDGNGGNYLDRIAIEIAKRNMLDDKKQYNLDVETFQEIDNWYNRLISSPSEFRDYERLQDPFSQEEPTGNTQEEQNAFIEKSDEISKAIKNDTQRFNRQIAIIKNLSKKKKQIASSNYAWKWKKKKTDNIDWVINKLTNELRDRYPESVKKKIHPKDLKYKNYVAIEDSDLKTSIIHANTMNAMLRNFYGTRYDSWTETLKDEAIEDLKSLKEFNKQTYGSNTLLDEIFPNGKTSLITNKEIFKFVEDYKGKMGDVYELRQNYLMNLVDKHGVNFLYAYMEPIRNRNDIGIFNNRPVAMPYKESARFRHGLQAIVGLANGKLELGSDAIDQLNAKNWGEWLLKGMIESNEHYRQFFDKDISMMNLTDSNMERFGLMSLSKNVENRMKQDNSDFDWLSQMLPSNPLATINKSVTQFYASYAEMIPDKSKENYIDFLKSINDLEEFSSRKDYLNPMKYIKLRLDNDKTFLEMIKKDIFTREDENGLPQHVKNNPMYTHLKYLKFEPKQIKSSKSLMSMLKSVNQVHGDLMTGARQNPMKDSGYESFRMMKDYAKCK